MCTARHDGEPSVTVYFITAPARTYYTKCQTMQAVKIQSPWNEMEQSSRFVKLVAGGRLQHRI
jgi:hypothetical protein